MREPAPRRILIADDDRELCELLRSYLARQGFAVEVVHAAEAALARIGSGEAPDLLILDVTMPGLDGIAALKRLRQHSRVPVLMLSARGEPVDRVLGLELGADDYLAKPALPRELLARVNSLLRRAPGTVGAHEVGALSLDPARRQARVAGAVLKLTAAEYGVLLCLVERKGTPVDKATLTREALGRPLERFDRSVDVHVSRLRRKLGTASSAAPVIDAVRGVGYVLVESA
jgi:two-component system response regulator CpxR